MFEFRHECLSLRGLFSTTHGYDKDTYRGFSGRRPRKPDALRRAVVPHLHITPFTFPWATLGVNVAGSFLIGLFYALSARLGLSEETRLFLTTGLCGGFTTFSTFSHEGLGMLRQGSYLPFLAYVTASVALGVTAALCGGWTGNACLPKG